MRLLLWLMMLVCGMSVTFGCPWCYTRIGMRLDILTYHFAADNYKHTRIRSRYTI